MKQKNKQRKSNLPRKIQMLSRIQCLTLKVEKDLNGNNLRKWNSQEGQPI